MKQMLSLLLAALCLAVPAPASAQTTTTSLAGVGRSDDRPVGAWALPEGVALEKVEGYSDLAWEECAPPDAEEPLPPEGAGTMVQVCLTLKHMGQGALALVPIWVELPPGVMFISDSESTQNGILIRRVRRQIRPGEVLFIPVYMMCLNSGRSGSYPGAGYKLGPRLINPAFDALFARLEGKALSIEAAAQIQGAVWDISKGKPIGSVADAYIDTLPNL